MKKYNSIFIGLCLILMVANGLLHLLIGVYKNQTPLDGPGDSQGGIGILTIWTLSWTITSIVAGIMLITTLGIGFKKKEILKRWTLLTIGLEIFTIATPIILLFFS